MPIQKVHFMGLLANVDSSILKVKLERGFKIERIERKDEIDRISLLQKRPYDEVIRDIYLGYNFMSQDLELYIIKNSFECDIEMDEREGLKQPSNEFNRFYKETHLEYLNSVLKLMRLFKEGNVSMPSYYYFTIDGNIPKRIIGVRTNPMLFYNDYELTDSEIIDLQTFIKVTKLPFQHPYLNLALKNYDISYHYANDYDLSFLFLMISLEALFNRGPNQIAYTISRNTAVLLGEDEDHSESIFQETKNLYKKRNKIVHGNQSNIITIEELAKLRQLVRESIKEIHNIKIGKDKLFKLLNSCGFGDRPWKK